MGVTVNVINPVIVHNPPPILVNVIKLTEFITFSGKYVESPTTLITLNNNSRIC